MASRKTIVVLALPDRLADYIVQEFGDKANIIFNPEPHKNYDIGLVGNLGIVRHYNINRLILWSEREKEESAPRKTSSCEIFGNIEELTRKLRQILTPVVMPLPPWTLMLIYGFDGNGNIVTKLHLWQEGRHQWHSGFTISMDGLYSVINKLEERERLYCRGSSESWLEFARDIGADLTSVLFPPGKNRDMLQNMKNAHRLYVVVKRDNPTDDQDPFEAFWFFSLPFEWLIIGADDPYEASSQDLLAMHVPIARYLGKSPSPGEKEFGLTPSGMRAMVLHGDGEGQYECPHSDLCPVEYQNQCEIRDTVIFPKLDGVYGDVEAVKNHVSPQPILDLAVTSEELQSVELAVVSAHGYPCIRNTEYGVLFFGDGALHNILQIRDFSRIMEAAGELKLLVLNVCLGAYHRGSRSSNLNAWSNQPAVPLDEQPLSLHPFSQVKENIRKSVFVVLKRYLGTGHWKKRGGILNSLLVGSSDKRPRSALTYLAQKLPGPVWMMAHRSYLSDHHASKFLSAFFAELEDHPLPPIALQKARENHISTTASSSAVDRLYMGAMLILVDK